MVRFAQPLLDIAQSEHAIQKAFALAIACWNLALDEEPQREALLDDLTRVVVKGGGDAAEFRALVLSMIERHREMFPELHRRPSTDEPARDVVRRLIGAGEHLTHELRRALQALGTLAVPALVELLDDDALATAPGGGWAPVHAAHFLGDLGATEAIQPMLRLLAETDWMDALHDALLQALPRLGPPVVEPALKRYLETDDAELRHALAAVLSEVGVRDERIFELLVAQVREDPGLARLLASYGDERAIPHLRMALDEYQIVDSESPFANQTLVELEAAIVELGGTLTEEQRQKCELGQRAAVAFREKLEAVRTAATRAEPARRSEVPGRNDPCWCASGRKYKKCHLVADEEEARAGGTDG